MPMRIVRYCFGAALASVSAVFLAACGAQNGFAPPNVAPATALAAASYYAAGTKIAPDFHDLGRAADSLPVRLTVTLRYRHQDELDSLVTAQSDPISPSFRHYLTNTKFTSEFSPSQQTYRRVRDTLAGTGFTVVKTFANRTLVEAVGTSGMAERLFKTQIDYGIQTGHGRRYMNVRDAVIPASLRDAVLAVSGLDNLVAFAPRIQLLGRLRGPNGELGPLGFQRAYDEPVLHGYNGSGRVIGNVIAGDIDGDDLKHFLRYFKIAPTHGLRRIAVDGGRFGFGDIETTLDVEVIMGTAPGAQVYLYSFPEFTDVYAEDAYNAIVDDDAVDAANSSWGGCESFRDGKLGHAFALASDAIFEQGAAKGITFPIATGDEGWETCRHHGTVDETTADSDPYALAVGGTTLRVDAGGNWIRESAWRGSAGGISVLFGLPGYQRRTHHVVAAGRNIPDVALDANPHFGFAERWHHIWVGAGGTSLGSPLWVGLEGQIDEYLGGRIGFANPELYAIERGPLYPTVFHDVHRGNNGGYRALPGYDLVTGLGSPVGWPLAQALTAPARVRR
ncbi:MAG: S53 family peptidase [Candidatus Cybelea sp.]|jgi:kumamolisin